MVLSLKLFQSTHPRRVWLIYTLYINTIYLCFNPHTHEGCDILLLEDTERKAVSIHTPTKGVTGVKVPLRYSWFRFNPHTHEGCDLQPFICNIIGMLFQSTHPRRVWQTDAAKMSSWATFQSTHPRRVWPRLCSRKAHRYRSFNPHTHEGCDGYVCPCIDDQFVSIHTPTKGVTTDHH